MVVDMSLTWNSWARLPSRRTSCAERSSACETLVAPAAVPSPRVDQYRSTWKTTLRGSVWASRVSYGVRVGERRLELPVVVVDHQRLAGLAGPLAERVEVLGVRDPLGLRRVARRAARPEVLDAEGLVLGQELVEVDGRLGRADVDVARRAP